MHKALGAQMGRNVESYIDNIIVKTREVCTFIEDLEETFANLRKVNIKLNPPKCAFGGPSGKLLGFLMSHHGIEVNPDKVKAIEEMHPPYNLKEMQRLVGCMAALGRFIARSGEKALPFFKLMKRTGKFEWTPKADKAFAEMKRYLTSLPIMVAPTFREPLLLNYKRRPHCRAGRSSNYQGEDRPSMPGRLLLRRRLWSPVLLVRSRPLHLRRPSCSLRALLLSFMRRKLPKAQVKCRSMSTSSSPYCATRGIATLCSKNCSTPCSSLQGDYVTTSKATRSRWSVIGLWRQCYATQMSSGGWQNEPWSSNHSRSPSKPPR
jgi:hypothetical protein